MPKRNPIPFSASRIATERTRRFNRQWPTLPVVATAGGDPYFIIDRAMTRAQSSQVLCIPFDAELDEREISLLELDTTRVPTPGDVLRALENYGENLAVDVEKSIRVYAEARRRARQAAAEQAQLLLFGE